jgi:hypothetical protein
LSPFTSKRHRCRAIRCDLRLRGALYHGLIAWISTSRSTAASPNVGATKTSFDECSNGGAFGCGKEIRFSFGRPQSRWWSSVGPTAVLRTGLCCFRVALRRRPIRIWAPRFVSACKQTDIRKSRPRNAGRLMAVRGMAPPRRDVPVHQTRRIALVTRARSP